MLALSRWLPPTLCCGLARFTLENVGSVFMPGLLEAQLASPPPSSVSWANWGTCTCCPAGILGLPAPLLLRQVCVICREPRTSQGCGQGEASQHGRAPACLALPCLQSTQQTPLPYSCEAPHLSSDVTELHSRTLCTRPFLT